MLRVAQQCDRLELGRTLACLHATHRGRGRLPHPEDRSATSAHLAPEAGAGRGAHPGVLSGLRVVEGSGATVPTRRVAQRTAKGISGIGGHHSGRCGVTDTKRSDDPKALHQSTDRASGDPAATPQSAPPQLARNGPNVVKTRPYSY